MLVLFVAYAVELQIGAVKSRIPGLTCKFLALRKPYTVSRGEYAIEADAFGMGDGVEEVRGQGRLTAGKQNDYLAAGLKGDRSIQYRFYLVQIGLVDIADLVRIRKARITHHVAPVGQIDGQDGSASILD